MGITQLSQAKAIKKKFIEKYLKNTSAACGLGKQDGEYCLEVRITSEFPSEIKLPKSYEGMKVIVKPVGEIKLL